jgi:hypothetical protein
MRKSKLDRLSFGSFCQRRMVGSRFSEGFQMDSPKPPFRVNSQYDLPSASDRIHLFFEKPLFSEPGRNVEIRLVVLLSPKV